MILNIQGESGSASMDINICMDCTLSNAGECERGINACLQCAQAMGGNGSTTTVYDTTTSTTTVSTTSSTTTSSSSTTTIDCSDVSIDVGITSEFAEWVEANHHEEWTEPFDYCDKPKCTARISGPPEKLAGLASSMYLNITYGGRRVINYSLVATCEDHSQVGWIECSSNAVPLGNTFDQDGYNSMLAVDVTNIHCGFRGDTSLCKNLTGVSSDIQPVADCTPSSEDVSKGGCFTANSYITTYMSNNLEVCAPPGDVRDHPNPIYQAVCDGIFDDPNIRYQANNGIYDNAVADVFALTYSLPNIYNSPYDPTTSEMLFSGRYEQGYFHYTGVCRHFASTMRGLARTIGVPAGRIVQYSYLVDVKQGYKHAVVGYQRDDGSWYMYDPLHNLQGGPYSSSWLLWNPDPDNTCRIEGSPTDSIVKSCFSNSFCTIELSSVNMCPVNTPDGGTSYVTGYSKWPAGECITKYQENKRCNANGVIVDDNSCPGAPTPSCTEACDFMGYTGGECSYSYSVQCFNGRVNVWSGDEWCQWLTSIPSICCCDTRYT